MVVMKFGGSVLQHTAGFSQMVSIIRNEPRRPIVLVVSALGTTTRELRQAANAAAHGSITEAMDAISAIETYHVAVASKILANTDEAPTTADKIHATLQEARLLLRSVSVARQLSARTMDRIMALGEDLSRTLAASVLSVHHIPAAEVDARELIVTTQASGRAEPLAEKSNVRIGMLRERLLSDNQAVIVTQGFVGQSEDGMTTTMGQESSNLSATFLAASLHASEVVIWTDVAGVRSIDPRYSTDSVVRSHLSYQQARLAALGGLKLIYPSMITPAEQAAIPIRIASAYQPSGDSTVIDSSDHAGVPVLIATTGDGTTSITVMFAQLGPWLNAIASLPQHIHDLHIKHVDADRASQAATIVADTNEATVVLDHLHHKLCRKNENA